MSDNFPLALPPPSTNHEEVCAFFKNLYQVAVKKTIEDGKLDYTDPKYLDADVLSLAQHLLWELESIESKTFQALTPFSQRVVRNFRAGLKLTVEARNNTAASTRFTEDLINFLCYVIIWLNSEKGYHLRCKLTSRRKALEEELNKLLDNSLEFAEKTELLNVSPPQIRDRFGIRLTFERLNPNELQDVIRIVIGILVDPYDSNRLEFKDWVRNSSNITFGGDPVPQKFLLEFMELSFITDHDKDFISSPTDSSYQSYHTTLHVVAGSTSVKGSMLEIQFRNYEMHQNAEYGAASHLKYEQQRRPKTYQVFIILDYVDGLDFYGGPDKPGIDMDGYSTHADIFFRKVSSQAMPKQIIFISA